MAHTWDGEPLAADERVALDLALGDEDLVVELRAPFYGDPAPRRPEGPCQGLWEYEVVELFLLGEDDRYLEIELGPFGHYLALQLRGPRQLERSGLELEYRSQRANGRWRGRARVPGLHLPPGLSRGNAYAIHGAGAARRYLAAHPVPGVRPDFHRLEAFRPLDW